MYIPSLHPHQPNKVMKESVFWGLVVAAVLPVSAQTAATVRVMAGGTLRLPGRMESFVPFVRTLNWKVNTTPVGLLDADISKGSVDSRLAANHVSYADGKVSASVSNGAVRINCRYVCRRDVADSVWGVRLKLNADSFKGCSWRFGDVKGTFPEKKSRGAKNKARYLELCMPDGVLYGVSFDEPVEMEWIDNRNWGSDAFIVTFGRLSPHAVRKGDVFEFGFVLGDASRRRLGVAFDRQELVKEGPEWVNVDYVKNIVPGSALDFSGMSSRYGSPAGKFGWLKNVGGHFEFERLPGVSQRFYGVNFCSDANYPDSALADEVAERFVRLGYNTIRFHHHDGGWRAKRNLFDYFMHRAIEKGLYITTDLYVSRRVKWKDIGVDRKGEVPVDMYKALCLFHEPTYADFISYVRDFMGHVNPHTGRRYADEPGMPFISVINEGALDGVWSKLKAEPLFTEEWKRWSAVNPKGGMLDYMTDKERVFMSRFRRFWKDELKAKALLSNQNRGPYSEALNQVKREHYDYVDRHFYRGHPKFPLKSWRLPSAVGHESPLKGREFFLSALEAARVDGLPFAVSEWNCGAPASFRSLGALAFGAYSASMGWDAAWRFAYSHRAEKMREGRHVMNYFDLSTDPLNQTSDRAAIALFLRGDGAETGADMQIDPVAESMTVITPRTCGVHAKPGEISAGPLKCGISVAPATVFAISLDRNGLRRSERILLVHLTDVQADGSRFSDSSRSLLIDWGEGGCVARTGTVEVRLAVSNPGNKTVFALGTDGSRKLRIPSSAANGVLTFTAAIRQSFGACFHYEIVSGSNSGKNALPNRISNKGLK